VGRKRKPQDKSVRKTLSGRIGARLEAFATAQGYTPAEFAEKIGKTEDAVWAYYRGSRVPKLDDWPKIATVLKLKNIREILPE
jgi:transcriptional regulator with XRE-family HTH domain